jgi:hypothetical protein
MIVTAFVCVDGLQNFVDNVLLLSDGMRAISDEQQYLKSRTIAHDEMAASTNARVAYWSMFEAAMVFSVSAFQVYWLRRYAQSDWCYIDVHTHTAFSNNDELHDHVYFQMVNASLSSASSTLAC